MVQYRVPWYLSRAADPSSASLYRVNYYYYVALYSAPVMCHPRGSSGHR